MAKEFLTAAENSAEISKIKSSISMEDLLKLDTIIVHGDRFHLDDVTFVAEIIATRQENGVTSIPEILRISRNDVQKTIDQLNSKNKKFIILKKKEGYGKKSVDNKAKKIYTSVSKSITGFSLEQLIKKLRNSTKHFVSPSQIYLLFVKYYTIFLLKNQ